MIRKSSGHAWGVHAIILLLSILIISTSAYSEKAYKVDGDFLVTTFKVWRKTAQRKLCETTHVPNTTAQLNNLTDEKFESLAGDYPAVGIASFAGLNGIYVREQRKWFRYNHPDKSEFNIDDYKHYGNLNDFPIVCAAGDLNLIAEVNARLVEQPVIDPPDLFKGKTGGEYLTAIYIGDFEKQNILAGHYLDNMSNGLSGAMARLTGGLTKIAGISNIVKQEPTVFEEVLTAYMSQFSRNGESCLTDGWFETNYTYELPDDVYYDEYGLETDRIDGGTRTITFKLNKEFAEACENLCRTGGTLAVSSIIESRTVRNKENNLGAVFLRVVQILENNNCSNPEVKQFEKNLLAMYAKERGVPLGDRNTLQNVLYPNR